MTLVLSLTQRRYGDVMRCITSHTTIIMRLCVTVISNHLSRDIRRQFQSIRVSRRTLMCFIAFYMFYLPCPFSSYVLLLFRWCNWHHHSILLCIYNDTINQVPDIPPRDSIPLDTMTMTWIAHCATDALYWNVLHIVLNLIASAVVNCIISSNNYRGMRFSRYISFCS